MANAQVAEKSGAAASTVKKGKLGLVFTLVLGVVLGSGLTMGVTHFVYADKPSEPLAGTAPADKPKPDEASKVRRIVALKPLIVNIKDTNLKRYLRVVIGLEVSNEEVVEELNRLDIPVHDFVVDRLGVAQMGELDSTIGRNRLKRELTCGINELLENGVVTRLYFADFIVQ
jgi:flagellar FliL protein